MSSTILIVDDDPGIREFLCSILLDEGFHVLEAADGVAALDVLAKHTADLIILDVMMPRLNGLEVCKAVRAAETDTAVPIIMISADNAFSIKEACRQAGANRFFGKPMAFEAFLAGVNDLLRVSPPA